ncbi:unnamed protein product, partial [Pocillopora meandrina]
TEKFSKGDLPLQYKGKLVSEDEGYQREDLHVEEVRSFLFFFKDGFKCLRLLFSNYDFDFCGFSSLDATFSAGLGRLKNDNPINKANEKD